ncbi:hypothetical protein BDV93DRAFT_516216 [Ceratobasidium sp. AG-I]|nr:hypothetical protein BDV93DRAFT_516216 [Ceratobasidium sp. AG-I]
MMPHCRSETDELKTELERLRQAAASNTTASETTSHGDLGVHSEDVKYVKNEYEKLGGQLEGLDYTTTGATSTRVEVASEITRKEQEATKAETLVPHLNDDAERQIEDLGEGRKELSRLKQEHERHESLAWEHKGIETSVAGLEQLTSGKLQVPR